MGRISSLNCLTVRSISRRRELRLPRAEAHLGIGHMPAVEAVAVARFEHDLLEFLAGINRRQPLFEEHRAENPVIVGHIEPCGGDSLAVVADVEFVVGQRPGVTVHYFGAGDAAVAGQGVDQGIGIGRQLVVIVAFEPKLVRAVVVDDVVVERVVVDAPDVPGRTAEIDRRGGELLFEHRRERAVFEFGFERDLDLRVVIGGNARAEHVDLIETADVVFHMPHNLVELLDGTPFGHSRVDIKAFLFRRAEIIVPVGRGAEQVQRRPEDFVDLEPVLGDSLASHDAVVGVGPCRGLPVLAFGDLVRQQECRDAEPPDQCRDEDPAVPAPPSDESPIPV